MSVFIDDRVHSFKMLISKEKIHLWFVYDEQIQDSNLLAQYYSMLNEEERAKQARFHFAKHRHQYLLTRAAIRTILSHYETSMAPSDWLFEANKYGKPHIINPEFAALLNFNISHTEGMIVIAITSARDIGVDVECLERPSDGLGIAQSYFSPIEVEQLFALAAENQKKRFYDLWTLKEAYIKACGIGLSIPLEHFSFLIAQSGDLEINFHSDRNDKAELWQFWQVQPNCKYKVSMALKGKQLGETYSIEMNRIVPLSKIEAIEFPLSHMKICTAEQSS